MNEHKHNYNMKINCLLALALSASSLAAQDAVIRVDAGKVENKITPYLYGACMEDVNHEIYGGLYDQKIFGESFEEPVSMDNFIGFTRCEGVWKPVLQVFVYALALFLQTVPFVRQIFFELSRQQTYGLQEST